MSKVDPTVKKETLYIALVILVLSMLMEAIFLITGKWDVTVLTGNLLGGGTALLNFFLLGLTVQKAVTKEQKDAATFMKLSLTYRNIMIIIVATLGLLLSRFNAISTLLSLLFPRIGIGLRVLREKMTVKEEKNVDGNDGVQD